MTGTGGGEESWGFTPTLCPSPPQQETVPDFPCTFFPPTLASTPPRPPPGPATLAPPRPLIVPKVERLSPPAPSGKEGLPGSGSSMGWREGKEEGGTRARARMRGTGQWDPVPGVGLSVGLSVPGTGGERRLSGELNSAPGPGTLSIHISPSQPIPGRGGRPDKVAPCLTQRSACTLPAPPRPSRTPSWAHPTLCPPDRKPAHHTHLGRAEAALQHQTGV